MIVFYDEEGTIQEVNHQTNTPFFNEELFTLEEVFQNYTNRGLRHKVLWEMGDDILSYKVEMDEEFNFIKLIEFEREEIVPVEPGKSEMEKKMDEMKHEISFTQDALNFILMTFGGEVQ